MFRTLQHIGYRLRWNLVGKPIKDSVLAHTSRYTALLALFLMSNSASALPPCEPVEYVVFQLLADYELDHGNLPYSPNGPLAALHSLKAYMDAHTVGGFYEPLGLVFYDTDELAAHYPFLAEPSSANFDYLNEPKMLLQANDPTIFLASNDYKETLELRCFTKGGQFYAVELTAAARNGIPQMVGRNVQELVPYTSKVLDVRVFDSRIAAYLRKEDNSVEDWANTKLRKDYTIPFDTIPDLRLHEIQMNRIKQALIQYSLEKGTLPYDRRGAKYALYLLHEVWPHEREDQALPHPLAFDHSSQTVTGLQYFYLNQRGSRFGDVGIVLAEATPWVSRLGGNEIAVLTCDDRGRTWLRKRPSIAHVLLGRGEIVLTGAETSIDSLEDVYRDGAFILYTTHPYLPLPAPLGKTPINDIGVWIPALLIISVVSGLVYLAIAWRPKANAKKP